MALNITPVPPFDFGLSCAVFAGGDIRIRTYDGRAFCQVVRIGGALALATVTSAGSTSRPGLYVELRGAGPLSAEQLEEGRRSIASVLNTGMDLRPFYRHVRTDAVLSSIVRRLRGLKAPVTTTVFESLVDSIIEQQISLKVAHVLEERLVKGFGSRLVLDGERYFIYPTPEQLALARPDELRKCGLSGRKAEYILGASRLVADKRFDIEGLGSLPGGDIIEALTGLRGVGVWTAELTMVRGLARLDAFPADDLGVRRAISAYYGRRSMVTPGRARELADCWGRWKGLASFYLLTAERLGVPARDGKK